MWVIDVWSALAYGYVLNRERKRLLGSRDTLNLTNQKAEASEWFWNWGPPFLQEWVSGQITKSERNQSQGRKKEKRKIER